MNFALKAGKVAVVGSAIWLSALGASAQMNPEGGDIGAGGSYQAGAQAQYGGMQQPAPPPMAPPMAQQMPQPLPMPPSGDHAAVSEHLGVGFFGVQTLPLLDPTDPFPAGGGAPPDVQAPTVGVRYWLNPDLGIEAALGLHVGNDSVEPAGGMTTSVSSFGFALHGGVPIALAYSGHFVFEIVPVLNFGVASGSVETTTGGMTAEDSVSGLLIEVGGKVGAEIHFGFIDLPNLSLQGTLGLTIRSESRSFEPMGGAKTDTSRLAIGTGVDGEPWDVFTGNIAAIYYL